MKKQILTVLCAAVLTLPMTHAENPKQEFRGAWIHTVHQSQYAKMTTDETKAYLCDQLDKLKAAGCNAVLFQVRPSADAFYPSELEPWSRFLTGTAGKAPSPYWDPLQFMIEESHARGMELHAWLNPYRVTTSKMRNFRKIISITSIPSVSSLTTANFISIQACLKTAVLLRVWSKT